jgi:hypothetical protein
MLHFVDSRTEVSTFPAVLLESVQDCNASTAYEGKSFKYPTTSLHDITTQKDHNLNPHCHENLKSRIREKFFMLRQRTEVWVGVGRKPSITCKWVQNVPH